LVGLLRQDFEDQPDNGHKKNASDRGADFLSNLHSGNALFETGLPVAVHGFQGFVELFLESTNASFHRFEFVLKWAGLEIARVKVGRRHEFLL